MEENALLYGISLFLADTPWYALGCVPFMDDARAKKRTMVLFGLLVGLTKAVSGGLLVAFVPDWRSWMILHFSVNALLLFFFYWRSFRTTIPKLLYTVLLIHAFSTAVNYLTYVVVVPFLPGKLVSMATTPAYTLAIMAGNALVIPFVWRFFRGRLRQAFLELPGRSIRLLCLPPILFYVFIQIYTAIIQAWLEVSSLSISLLNLLLAAMGLATYYINLRTVLDGAQRAREQSELQAQLALKEQAARVRSDMIDTLSHEVRTPLSVMSVYAQLAVRQIQSGRATEQTAADLLTISEEAKRLAELADSTLQLSRMSDAEAARREPETALLDIGAVTTQICRLFSSMAKQRGRELTIALPDALPFVRCDADSLTRLLWNLLDNALTHSGHGDIVVSGEADKHVVRIVVRDEGVGIPPELMPRIFERGVSGAPDGTGLGLAISRQAARQHGGDVTLESRYGHGATATLTLPAAEQEGAGENEA